MAGDISPPAYHMPMFRGIGATAAQIASVGIGVSPSKGEKTILEITNVSVSTGDTAVDVLIQDNFVSGNWDTAGAHVTSRAQQSGIIRNVFQLIDDRAAGQTGTLLLNDVLVDNANKWESVPGVYQIGPTSSAFFLRNKNVNKNMSLMFDVRVISS